jgi:hypothetical protein
MFGARSGGELEWVLGGVALAASWAFVWMNSDGLVVGSTLLPLAEVAAAGLGASFREATRRPMSGAPHVPERVRVASESLADALRREIGGETEVVCAPTPELDEHFAAFAA